MRTWHYYLLMALAGFQFGGSLGLVALQGRWEFLPFTLLALALIVIGLLPWRTHVHQ